MATIVAFFSAGYKISTSSINLNGYLLSVSTLNRVKKVRKSNFPYDSKHIFYQYIFKPRCQTNIYLNYFPIRINNENAT